MACSPAGPGRGLTGGVLASEGVRAGAGLDVLRSAVALVERGWERAGGRLSFERLWAAE